MYKEKIMAYFENVKHPITIEEVAQQTETELSYIAVHTHHPHRTMKLMFDDEMRKYFRKYCKNTYENFEEVPLRWIGDFISVPVLGKVGKKLFTFMPVLYEDFGTYVPGIPEVLKIASAAKAHLYDCDEVVVFLVCRNTQKTFTHKYAGDFSDAFSSIEEKVNIIAESINTLKAPEETAFLFGGSIRQEKGTEEGLQLSEYLEGLNDKGEDAHRKDTKIHPSEFTYSPCDRRQVYRLLGYESKPKISGHLRKVFDYGHSIHEVIQDALRAHHDIVIEQKVLHEDLNMTGSCDGYLGGHVLEIKSKGHKGLETMVAKGKGPAKEHIAQATIYAAGLDCDKTSIVYVDKNTGEVVEYVSDFDHDLWYKIKERAKNLLYHRDTKTLPEGIDKKYKCKECPYLEDCHPEWMPQNNI
jgi:hypothetical protein